MLADVLDDGGSPSMSRESREVEESCSQALRSGDDLCSGSDSGRGGGSLENGACPPKPWPRLLEAGQWRTFEALISAGYGTPLSRPLDGLEEPPIALVVVGCQSRGPKVPAWLPKYA